MAAYPEIKVLENCRVAPPPDAATEFTVPLSFFDMQWLVSDAHHHLLFYRFPNPSTHPTSTNFVISSIKSSLSLVLKHFLPLAGNLIWPVDSDTKMPELRYMKGDSVSLTIVESNMEFDYLVGDHQRESYKFCNLFPQLPEPYYVTTGSRVSPVFALQVTLFPKNIGICIGRTLNHVLGDATSFFLFSRLWVLLDKYNEDSLKLLAPSRRPLYDRSVVQDPFDLRLKIFNEKKLLLKSHCTTPTLLQNPTLCNKDEVRATFILHPIDITKLKKFVSSRNTSSNNNNNPSAFTVTCALIWTCLSKSLDDSVKEKTETEEDKDAYLCAYINYRQRFDPPIPQNYFGNGTVPCMVEANHGQLVGKDGLWVAAAAVGDAIHKRLHDNKGFLRGDWMSSPPATTARRNTLVYMIGSAQTHLHDYDADFGWGKMEKHEYVSTADSSSSTSLMLITRSRRFKGAIEVSTSLPKSRMDTFSTIFTNSVNNLHIRSPL